MESGREEVFKVKWTRYKGFRVPYLLQNTDGECPLICLTNVLLFKRKFELPPGTKVVGFPSLCSYICSTLPHANSEWVTSILRSLRKGLIFNCRFDSTRAMIESDPEQLFLSFEVPIKHGWIADPLAYGVLSKYNYDQLLENLAIYQSKDSEEFRLESELERMTLNVAKEEQATSHFETGDLKESNVETKEVKEGLPEEKDDTLDKEDKETDSNKDQKEKEKQTKHDEDKENKDTNNTCRKDKEKEKEKEKNKEDEFDDSTASLAIEFLERYATQITEYGLKVLKHEVDEGTLVALYRNNHFLVATKHEGQLFTLVTDSAFYEHTCVWESLETSEYFDENFNRYVQLVKEKTYRKAKFMEKFKRVFRRKPKR